MLCSIIWLNFIVWIAFASQNIEQYVYHNNLFPGLSRHKFSNQFYLPDQAAFIHNQIRYDKNLNTSKTNRAFKM